MDFSYRSDIDVDTRGKRSKAITPIREKMPAFLERLALVTDNPEGEGFNNSTQYVFNIRYASVISNKQESIKLEISLRQPPFLPPVDVAITHFYQDPFTGENLFPQGTILALSLEESFAEKLKAAISRLTPAIRDYYDLAQIIATGFNFQRPEFLKIVNKKLRLDGYKRDYSHNLGLSDHDIIEMKRTIKTDLIPMIRTDQQFDLDKVLKYFNKLFAPSEIK